MKKLVLQLLIVPFLFLGKMKWITKFFTSTVIFCQKSQWFYQKIL